jgi:hypothetical protein
VQCHALVKKRSTVSDRTVHGFSTFHRLLTSPPATHRIVLPLASPVRRPRTSPGASSRNYLACVGPDSRTPRCAPSPSSLQIRQWWQRRRTGLRSGGGLGNAPGRWRRLMANCTDDLLRRSEAKTTSPCCTGLTAANRPHPYPRR